MKNKFLIFILSLFSLFFIFGCGISTEKYDNLVEEYNALQAEQSRSSEEYDNMQTQLNEKIAKLERELEKAKSDYQDILAQNEDLQYELQKYKDTGISVYDSIKLPSILKYQSYDWDKEWKESDYVKLANNKEAQNPTFATLMSFLTRDDTDSFLYMENFLSGRICGWFAERVHNNAESARIKSAFVIINYVDVWEGHALNAFNTVDKGLIFIDCTGEENVLEPIKPFNPWVITYEIGDTNCFDCIAYIKIGKPYGLININKPYGLEYSEYERWQRDVELMKARFNRTDDSHELNQICNESDSQLGSFFQPSEASVESIEIYW